jgi:hypothetical protein
MAAFAKDASPKNSKIKGKHDKPGARDGINNFAVFALLELLSTPIIVNNIGVTANNMILKDKAKTGNKIRLLSTFTFSNAIKIVAGKAIVRIKLFNPLVSSPLEIFFFKRTPIKIKRINESDFSKATSIN